MIPIQLGGDVAYSILARRMNFSKDAIWSMISGSLGALIAVGMAWFGFGVWSLVGQLFVSAIVRLVGLLCRLRIYPAFCLFLQPRSGIDQVFLRHDGIGNSQFRHLPVAYGYHCALSRSCRCRRLLRRKPIFQSAADR
jgi:hypothetical protein